MRCSTFIFQIIPYLLQCTSFRLTGMALQAYFYLDNTYSVVIFSFMCDAFYFANISYNHIISSLFKKWQCYCWYYYWTLSQYACSVIIARTNTSASIMILSRCQLFNSLCIFSFPCVLRDKFTVGFLFSSTNCYALSLRLRGSVLKHRFVYNILY